MNDIKKSLTRKLGPFPVWTYVAAVGVFFLYHTGRLMGLGKKSGGDATQGQQYVSGASAGPNLDYVPGGGAPVSSGYVADPNGAPGSEVQQPDNSVDPGLVALLGGLIASQRGTPADPVHPGSTAKPTTKRGGHGKGTAKKPKTKHQKRSRGAATVRKITGGRTKGATKGHLNASGHKATGGGSPTPSLTAAKTSAASRTRRPPVAVVANKTQRPEATHPTPAVHSGVRPAPRPSSPPRRSAPRVAAKKRK